MTIPAEPHERLLNRYAGKAGNAEYLEALDQAFSRLLNESTWVFSRLWETTSGDLTAEICLLLVRHIMEMTDAVHLLLLASASRPAQLQLRSAFEAMLYLEFILERDSERRALAYAVGSRLHSLRFAKRLLEGSEARAQFVKEVEQDPLVTDEMLTSWIASPESVKAAEDYLESELYRDVYAEFKKSRKRIPWYSALEGKPTDLRALAIHLDRGGQYILLDGWSRTVHPDTIPTQIDAADREERRVRTLRDGGDIGNCAASACRLLDMALELVLERYRPGELDAFRATMAQHILPGFAELGPTDVIHYGPSR